MSGNPDPSSDELRTEREAVNRFILDEIDTVPHLEALLLLWRTRPREWSVREIGQTLYITDEDARTILEDMVRRGLISATLQAYVYNPRSSRDALIAEVEEVYRRELVRISRMIHLKPSSAVREFARAFRLKKD